MFTLSLRFLLLFSCIAAFGPVQFTEARSGIVQSDDRSPEEVITKVKTDEKVIALTFDDGPDTKYTPQILDLLKEYEAKATFFVVGWRVEKFPDLIVREDQEGHELGNHTYTHLNYRRMNAAKLHEEIRKTQEAIFAITGKTPQLYRPPEGYLNAAVRKAAKKEDLRIVNWSWDEDTRDWSRPGVKKIVNKVLNHVHSGDIILFHDYDSGKSQTVQALKQILPELDRRGYRLVTVSELLNHDNKTSPSATQ